MSDTVRKSVRIPRALYEAAAKQARLEERDTKADDGVGLLIRKALRAYLNKQGYSASELDET
jgi:hypothetical protein